MRLLWHLDSNKCRLVDPGQMTGVEAIHLSPGGVGIVEMVALLTVLAVPKNDVEIESLLRILARMHDGIQCVSRLVVGYVAWWP